MRATLDMEGVLARMEAWAREAERRLGEAVLRDCAAYVPYRTGELAASGVVVDGGVEWTAGHARAVYYGDGMRFGTEVHPLASAQWFEKARGACGEAWAETAVSPTCPL